MPRSTPNRLAQEKSPYLLQHAYNPVDWQPWDEEALAKARNEDKPIFLSIGYSTCHWCHVMEHESFEDEGVAAVLNEHFVPIKVDREERPDLDRVYMLFVQASTGSGGWPMSVWLTPDGRPFFGGTYFPPDNRYGRPGFRAILERLAQAWREDRARIEDSGTQVVGQLARFSFTPTTDGTAVMDQAGLDKTYSYFRRTFDSKLGGFGQAPKFPRPVIYNFLFRYAAQQQPRKIAEQDATEMVLATLDAMAAGGMHDQLGGGFHRYSVDAHWFVPHFEKMLYDQAQLAISYLEAFQISGEPRYAAVARDIFDYVLRDLTSPQGGFYSAEDADSAPDAANPSHKSEGAFYIWTQDEIVAALGEAEGAKFCEYFGVKPTGNVDEDPHGEFRGRNILYRARAVPPADFASVERSMTRLLEIRASRPRPHLDDKILTGWNGMMISALAKGAQILGEARYADAARRAQLFLFANLWKPESSALLRRYRDGEAAIPAFLDDYAMLIQALMDLYETFFDAADLKWAEQLAQIAIAKFEDPEGSFFSTSEESEDLILRLKDDYDGAEPSANSVMTCALLKLARMTGRDDFQASAERALAAFATKMVEAGPGLPQMLVAHLFATGKPMEIILAGPENAEMLAELRRRFLPNAIVMRTEDAPGAARELQAAVEKPTIYVCENFACQLPASSVDELKERLS